MLVVAHIKELYLALTETFIYSYLSNFQNVQPIILVEHCENIETFPLSNISIRSELQQHSRYTIMREKFWFRVAGYSRCFANIIKQEKVLLLHAHYGPNGVCALPLKRATHLPLITTFYGYDMRFRNGNFSQSKDDYQKLFLQGNIFLVEGTTMKKQLIEMGCPPQKIYIQHIGIDTNKIDFYSRELPLDGKIKILLCGRFVEKKGLTYALDAIGILFKKHPAVQLRIVGDGLLRQKIEEKIHNLGIEKNIILLGNLSYTQHINELYQSHIILQPSVTAKDGDCEGGAPTVLLEAQASGLPVVATYHCDIPEVVIDGKSGFLVPERDSEALAQKLEELINHPDLWAKMGKAGRDHIVANYEIHKQVEKLEDIYLKLANLK